MVLQCLSYLALHYTQSFCDYFRLDSGAGHTEAEKPEPSPTSTEPPKSYTEEQHTMKELLQLVTFADPLIRGNLAHVIASFISGLLRNPHTIAIRKTEDEQSVLGSDAIDLPSLINDYLLRLLLDESANVRKMVCRALVTCFNDILASAHARCAITILYTLIDSIREDTYWLVKTEVRLRYDPPSEHLIKLISES